MKRLRNIAIIILGSAPFVPGALATQVFVPIDIRTATGTTTSQSSSHPAGPADNGVDGNPGNFTHTLPNDLNPSWTANLGRDETFNLIVVHNRDDCCADRLVDVTVQVFDSAQMEIYNSGPTNAGNVLGSPAFITFELPAAVTGRSITVSRDGASNPNPGVLSIGELQVGNLEDVEIPPGTDLTQSGIAGIAVSQSPTSGSPPGGGFATNGIDGNPGNFTHTSADVNVDHSWQIDFGEELGLERVDVANRSNCCGERLRDVTLTVLDGEGATVFTSEVFNPGNALGLSGTNQQGFSVDLAAANGGAPVLGQTVVITRTPDPGGTNADDMSVLSVGEVTVIGGSASSAPFRITAFTFDDDTGDMTITWSSRPGTMYIIHYTTDLSDLMAGGDVVDGIVDNAANDADPAEGSITFEFTNPIPGADHLFFSVHTQ